MSTPTKEDLPRIADTLKSELEGEHKLKHTETQEKVVLPSKTGELTGDIVANDRDGSFWKIVFMQLICRQTNCW